MPLLGILARHIRSAGDRAQSLVRCRQACTKAKAPDLRALDLAVGDAVGFADLPHAVPSQLRVSQALPRELLRHAAGRRHRLLSAAPLRRSKGVREYRTEIIAMWWAVGGGGGMPRYAIPTRSGPIQPRW